MLLESLLRFQWEAFVQWLHGNDEQTLHTEDDLYLLKCLNDVHHNLTDTSINTLVSTEQFQSLYNLYQQFVETDNGPMKKFWSSYIEIVLILLRFIRASRDANWELHLQSVSQILPWIHAYDQLNYAKYLALYFVEMKSLPSTHPGAHNLLMNGGMSVQRNQTYGFTGTPVDQTIEQTINRNTKTRGGIIGFSLKPGAVKRWINTAHQRSSIVDACRTLAGIEGCCTLPKDMQRSRIQKDEADIIKLQETIEVTCNPFLMSDSLVALSSGCKADASTCRDLLEAKDRGTESVENFITERIATNLKSFHDTKSRLKLKTFSLKTGTQLSTERTKLQKMSADRSMFARLLVVAQKRSLDLRNVFEYELGPVPWSLATVTGSIQRTNKASLCSVIELESVPLETMPVASVCIIDFMRILQGITHIPDTFAELADSLLMIILSFTTQDVRRIDIVADQYHIKSIKAEERSRREMINGTI